MFRLTTTRLTMVLAAGLSLVFAAELRAGGDYLRDAHHTWLARRIMERDPDLARLNLGVKVQNRVVTLWGPVPDIGFGIRAADLLRGQTEFRAVYNDLYFQPDDVSQIVPLRPDYLPDVVPQKRKAPERGQDDGHASVSLLPPQRVDERKRPVGSPGTLTTRPAVKKAPALLVPEKKSEPKTPPAVTLTTPVAAQSPVLDAVRTAQAKQARFRDFRFELQDGVVTVRGPAQQAEALYEFVNVVAQLPGVGRVLVKEE